MENIILTAEQESQQRTERLARVTAVEDAAKKVQDDRIATTMSTSAKINAEYFEKQRKFAEEVVAATARNAAAQPKPKSTEQIVAENADRYLYAPYDKSGVDVLLEKEPECVQRQFNYVPLSKRPKSAKVIAKPQPPQVDPLTQITHPEMALKQYPLSAQDRRNAELFGPRPASVYSGPMRECDTCGATVPSNSAWHEVNGKKCAADKQWCSKH